MRWRRWGLALTVLATLGGLTVADRLLDLPETQLSPTTPPPSTTTNEVVSVTTLPPPATIPAALRRPLRLPGLRRDGSCPTSPMVGPSITRAHPVAAVAVGDGPVYPVLFRATAAGRLDHSSVAYWDAPKPLGGPAGGRVRLASTPWTWVRRSQGRSWRRRTAGRPTTTCRADRR